MKKSQAGSVSLAINMAVSMGLRKLLSPAS